MLDTEIRELRRFCYTVLAVLLIICATDLLGILFVRNLSIGTLSVALLLLLCCMLLQHMIADRLGAYLDTGIRYYLKRFSLCFVIFLVRLLLHHARKLTSDLSIMLIIAIFSILPLADIVHSIRKLRRK